MIVGYVVRVVAPTIAAVAACLTVGAGLGSAAPTTPGHLGDLSVSQTAAPRVAPITYYYVNATTGPNAAFCQGYVDRANYYLGRGEVNEAQVSVQKGTDSGCAIVTRFRLAPMTTAGVYALG